MRFRLGDPVLTVKPGVEPQGYVPGARDSNQWDQVGVVRTQRNIARDRDGECYRVQHPNGGYGWYEPLELRPSPMGGLGCPRPPQMPVPMLWRLLGQTDQAEAPEPLPEPQGQAAKPI